MASAPPYGPRGGFISMISGVFYNRVYCSPLGGRRGGLGGLGLFFQLTNLLDGVQRVGRGHYLREDFFAALVSLANDGWLIVKHLKISCICCNINLS